MHLHVGRSLSLSLSSFFPWDAAGKNSSFFLSFFLQKSFPEDVVLGVELGKDSGQEENLQKRRKDRVARWVWALEQPTKTWSFLHQV